MSPLNAFLSGVRVVDLSRHFPGPLATLILADMGAEVVKIEPPSGDEMRLIGPQGRSGRSVYFDAVNAGKRSRRLDLRDAAAKAELMELVRASDILVHSFRPGVMDRLGLSDDALKAANPRLIRCGLTGYGETGPLRSAAGHDANYLALAGILHRNGGEAPFFFEPPLADVSAALFGVIAILGALQMRRESGLGCQIDLGLADAVMPLQLFQLAELAEVGRNPQRRSELLNGGAAFYQVYATRDGRHVALGAVEPKFWQAFCQAAGQPAWIPRQADPLPQQALKAELREYFGAMTLTEVEHRFEMADCCLSPVLDLEDAVAQTHYRERGLLRAVNGTLQALFPARVDGEPPRVRTPFEELDSGAIPSELQRG